MVPEVESLLVTGTVQIVCLDIVYHRVLEEVLHALSSSHGTPGSKETEKRKLVRDHEHFRDCLVRAQVQVNR